MIGQRRRHTRLHDALCDLVATHAMQEVDVPANTNEQYYRKYAHTLAARWDMKVTTRMLITQNQTVLIISERTTTNREKIDSLRQILPGEAQPIVDALDAPNFDEPDFATWRADSRV